MAYSNPYINNLSGMLHNKSLTSYTSGSPYGQSLVNLYKPYFAPPAPGGGYQPPLAVSPLIQEAAPHFTGLTTPTAPNQGTGKSIAEGGTTSKSAGANTGIGGDPILAKAQALADEQSSAALAAAKAAEKTNIIRLGDPDLVNRVLGGMPRVYRKGPMAGQDSKASPYSEVAKAAANNPFSTLKELDRWNQRQVTGINEQRNKEGLFYSSTRARDQAMQAEDQQRQRTKAYNDFQDAIAAIQQALVQSQMGIRQNLLTAQENAYNRQLAQGGG